MDREKKEKLLRELKEKVEKLDQEVETAWAESRKVGKSAPRQQA